MIDESSPVHPGAHIRESNPKPSHSSVTTAAQQARPYVAPFLSVKANDIERWFTETIAARTKFPVLLRTLVHSKDHALLKVDFPGNDDAERPGWDGFVESNSATPWLPAGISGWEFGVTKDIKGKADGDFSKSVNATENVDRQLTTFVFVTPRRWPGKTAWVTAMKAENLWKDVRAYDSSDLEQWMEQSIAAQIWFANQTDRPSYGVRTLGRCWDDWANVADPPLHPSLFASAKEVWTKRIKDFLQGKIPNPLILKADSVEEALAFLRQVFDTPELKEYRDRVLVFDQPHVLPILAQCATDFIAVAHTREVECACGPFSTSLRMILVYLRNASHAASAIVLEPLRYEPFAKALKVMGQSPDDILELANKSGCSLTVLRRQLSRIPAIRKPVWADDFEMSSGLIPFVLAGAWEARKDADRDALSQLAGGIDFEALERRVARLLPLNDSPVWSIGDYRGVVSKIDSLFAIAEVITKADLTRFLEVAKWVLGEDDPALDLPEGQRLAAGILGQRREFSDEMRKGISETLVLLAVRGKDLFYERMSFDGAVEASKLVCALLEPLSSRRLEANARDLHVYAEAAPDAFLKIIERDLRKEKPEVMTLLRPFSIGSSGLKCPRADLLLALEGLAWSPETFIRVVLILGRLSELALSDNLLNEPVKSLGSIFCAWMPQTAADHGTRLEALRMLLESCPDIGWKICVEQLPRCGPRFGEYNHKPKWRPDGYGYGEPFKTTGPTNAFVRDVVKLSLSRPSYSTDMIGDLVSSLYALAPKDQDRIWTLIEDWRHSGPFDVDIAKVREIIRVNFLTRRELKRVLEEAQVGLIEKAKAVYATMEPKELVNKYVWMFWRGLGDLYRDELSDDEPDSQAFERLLKSRLIEALSHILRVQDVTGILALAEKGCFQGQIAEYLTSGLLDDDQMQKLILHYLRSERPDEGCTHLISAALRGVTDDRRETIYTNLRGKISEGDALHLLLLSPYRPSIWRHVDQLSDDARLRYWDEVVPQDVPGSNEDNNESVCRLLTALRPWAAFKTVECKLKDLDPKILVKMLGAMAENNREKRAKDHDTVYFLRCAFRLLSHNPDVSAEEKAWLEFAFIKVLARYFRGGEGHQIPNLEQYIEEHPEMFVQAVIWAYKRDDLGEDPPEFHNTLNRKYLAKRSIDLVLAIERIPGQDLASKDHQREKLAKWVDAVRQSCADLGRLKAADFCIGRLLSHAPVGEDGIWPSEVVRDVMEDIESEEITRGARDGRYNARGVIVREEGGGQERGLADTYRSWAAKMQFTHPFVASSLLKSLVGIYEWEAGRHDTEARIRLRMRH